MKPLRKHVALAIDGGGIKGLAVAQALVALEYELGSGPLIQHPRINILAGTSTGSVITAGIAMGMTAREIADLYQKMGQLVFPALTPAWLPRVLKQADEYIRIIFQHSLYSSRKLIELLKSTIQQHTGDANLTLAQLNQELGPDKALIITTVDIAARRTRFLKTYKQDSGDWTLWEAILASSSAPIAFPVFKHNDAAGKLAYYTDGGVGSYGNPAYVAAMEAVVFHGYLPEDVSVLSFGTGWVNDDTFLREVGVPTGWRGLDIAQHVPDVILGDTIRSQSLDIIEGFGDQPIDFRRFQFRLDASINGDAYSDDATYAMLKKVGDEVGERVRRDQYAPNENPAYDPEGLFGSLKSYRVARQVGKQLWSK